VSKPIDVREIVRKYQLDKYPNVVGYSNVLQKKIRGGRVTDIDSIRIYVTEKIPEEKLARDEVIPKVVDGIPTDVVAIGRLRKKQYKGRYRPSPTGVSTSRADERASGTIGWWLVDEDGYLYLLSNNHVWAKENLGVRGDKIVQPGVLDGGDPEKDVIAELYDFIPIDFSGATENYVDVAIATPIDMSQLYVSIMEIGGVAGKRDANLNEDVCKVGRSTGKTCGTVTDTSATVIVDYDTGSARFTDVFLVQSSSKIVEAGDSGSPVVSSDGKFLGLLFAGNDNGTLFVGCKSSRIEQSLQAKLGKKIWILIANAYPPFRVEQIIQTVYPPIYQTMALSIIIAMIPFIMLPIVESIESIER